LFWRSAFYLDQICDSSSINSIITISLIIIIIIIIIKIIIKAITFIINTFPFY